MTTFFGDPDNPHTATVREISDALDDVRAMQDQVLHIAHHSRSPLSCRHARKEIETALGGARRTLLKGLVEAKVNADIVDLAHIQSKTDE